MNTKKEGKRYFYGATTLWMTEKVSFFIYSVSLREELL